MDGGNAFNPSAITDTLQQVCNSTDPVISSRTKGTYEFRRMESEFRYIAATVRAVDAGGLGVGF